MAATAATYLKTTDGKLHGRPPTSIESRYLLSGLSACRCGSGFMAHSRLSGRTRWRYYVCTGYHNKGASTCANGLPLPMREADDAVLTPIRDYVLQPTIVEGALADAVEMLRPQADTVDAQRANLQAQRAHIEQQLQALDGLRHVSQVDMGRIARDLRARVTEWRRLLTKQVPVSR